MSDAAEKPALLISRLLPEPAIALARSRASVDAYDQDAPMPRAALLERLAGRQGLICVISEAVDQALLDACPKLRVVANVAVGYNNVDVAACTQRGVVVTNTPDVLTDTTADFAWTLLMATARRLVEADRYVREGRFKQWEYMLQLGGDIHGKTLGVVGFGRIGRAMARRALGFGMRVLYQDAVAADAATERELNATRVDLVTLLREADFVTLHTPLIPETRHLMNR
jgi:glyoxylate reductase